MESSQQMLMIFSTSLFSHLYASLRDGLRILPGLLRGDVTAA
jgi:hypothetical protein